MCHTRHRPVLQRSRSHIEVKCPCPVGDFCIGCNTTLTFVWLVFNAVFNFFSSYHCDQFTYSCVSWFSHTSTPHNILSKQLAAFPHRLLNSPLVNNEWRRSQWLLSNVWKNVGRAGIQTHNPWIDSPRCYRLSYRGSDLFCLNHKFLLRAECTNSRHIPIFTNICLNQQFKLIQISTWMHTFQMKQA